MEVPKEYLLLKISQFEKAAENFEKNAVANRGAAEGLRNILKELEDLEKQEPVKAEDLLRGGELVTINNGSGDK